MSDIEERLGMGMSKIMAQELSFAMIRVCLWAGLKWQDRGLTTEKVGRLMNGYLANGGTIEDLGEIVGKAIVASGLFNLEEADLIDEGDDDPNSEPEAVTT